MLMEQNVMPMKEMYDFSTKVLYSKQKSMVDNEIRPDSILTPLLYAFNNNLNEQVQVCVGDIPMLVHRERLANSFKVEQLKAIFTEVIEEWGDHGNFGFNPEVKYSEFFQKPRAQYIAELLR
jgi:hypothetical protein